MTELPNDYTRCMGVSPDCLHRDNCARLRSIPENFLLSWTQNLNPDNAETCSYFIPFHSTSLPNKDPPPD